MGFKVGNIVKLKSFGHFSETCALTIGKEYEIAKVEVGCFYVEGDNDKLFLVLEEEFVLFEKVSKNKKRIEHLENVVSQLVDDVQELHLIVHGLRGGKKVEGLDYQATESETIIGFEGNQYCKVDREAREGDVVVLKGSMQSQYILNGVPYKTFIGRYDCLAIQANGSDHIKLYSNTFKRTLETVNVYELIEQPKGEVKQGINNEQAERLAKLLWSEPKTVNQQRAEIIEKAKVFYEGMNEKFDFVIDKSIGLVTVLDVSTEGVATSLLKQGLVFNEHIQKAIAIGKLKGIDVSEFENAVQPNEAVEGMVIRNEKDYLTALGGPFKKGDLFTINETIVGKDKCQSNSAIAINGTIINDTNAQYEYEVTA